MTTPAPLWQKVIQLMPLGPVSHEELLALSTTITVRFGIECEILPSSAIPAAAYRPMRGQYDADTLLEYLFDRLEPTVHRIVGVTGADLFAEGRNFVFGYAHMRDRVAVFSTLRLQEAYWDRPDVPELYRSRVDKALTHELGHTFHVPHCTEDRCVMHQVEFLWQLDQLDMAYCGTCQQRVFRAVRRGVNDPETLFELAGSYMRRRRFARAAATYAAAAAAAPDNAHYHNDHGVALLALGDCAAASRAFEHAVRLRPMSPFAYYNLGIVSRERGDVGSADRFFTEALRRDEDPKAGHRYLGILHQDYFRDPARAQRHLERYRALGGEDLEVARRLKSLKFADVLDDDVRRRFAERVTESTAPV